MKSEVEVNIDTQGRILIPAEVRGKLNLEPNSPLELILSGNELILRKKNIELENKVQEWKNKLLSMDINEDTSEDSIKEQESNKWVDAEHVAQKLGLG